MKFFSLTGYYGSQHVHLGMPWSANGTDGASLAIPVGECIQIFNLQNKVVSYTSDGGSNLKTCKEALDLKVNNSAVFDPVMPIFEQDGVAYVLSGACKVDIVDSVTADGMLSTSKT